MQLANGIAKGMVVLRAGGNPKGGQKRGAGRTKARRRGNAGERPGAVERGSVAAGGGPWGERAWRGGREGAGREMVI